jgi:hypothetical protein
LLVQLLAWLLKASSVKERLQYTHCRSACSLQVLYAAELQGRTETT